MFREELRASLIEEKKRGIPFNALVSGKTESPNVHLLMCVPDVHTMSVVYIIGYWFFKFLHSENPGPICNADVGVCR